MSATSQLYLLAVAIAGAISWSLTPGVRWLALKRGWVDSPSSAVKTHKETTPCVGGIAIFAAFVGTLLLLRVFTDFPTGTLYRLRGLVIGGTVIFLMGLLDDITKPYGLHYRIKFVVQMLAAVSLLSYGIRIRFITPDYLAAILTVFWVVGITNALNIVDIMDGLCASQAAIAALGFLMISLPSEELYVNFASAAIAGAALGFLPWNFSARGKMFMGDSGSMLLGYVLSAIALGTRYTEINNIGVYAPLLILFVPMYDTLFVMVLRLKHGQSPFLGSHDHFALRLEAMRYTRPQIVTLAAGAAMFLGFCAYLVTQLSMGLALCLYAVVTVEVLMLSRALAGVRVQR